MTGKEYLKGIKDLNASISRKTEDIFELRSRLYTVSASRINGDRITSTPAADPLADGIARLEELESDWSMIVDAWVDRCREAERLINQLPSRTHGDVLRLYYLSDKKWTDVALAMGYSKSHIERIHGHALQLFERINAVFLKDDSK